MSTITTKLDKKARNALPNDQFAVPSRRLLPINDEHHTKLAWTMVDQAKLSDEERVAARAAIVRRASELGMDTAGFHKLKAMAIECMSLNISADDGHPNKMPFSGVLTRLDEPSDEPPGGSGGRRIIVTSSAAQAALGSLLGMAVDFTPSFDGHDSKNKIGIITSANVVGSELQIEGFVYAADFPETADLIQELKDVLGFSFEAQQIKLEDPSSAILRITELTFTGAAILLKNKAAYTTTSLAASADENGELNMTAEELQAILANALKPITDRLAVVESTNTTIVADIQANAKTRALVEPLAASIEQCAAAMEAAGVGADATRGHVNFLRKMADNMRSEAALGRLPSAMSYDYYAAAKTGQSEDVTAQIKAAVDAAVKPLQDQLAAAETKLKDASTTTRLQAGAPDRKTVSPATAALLSKASLAMPEGDKKLTVGEVDKAMQAAGMNLTQKIMLKNDLTRMGALA